MGNLYLHNIKVDFRRLFDDEIKSQLFNLHRHCQHSNCNVNNYKELTVDHKKPWSQGGTTTKDNAQLLCIKHNSGKRNMTYEEWLNQTRH